MIFTKGMSLFRIAKTILKNGLLFVYTFFAAKQKALIKLNFNLKSKHKHFFNKITVQIFIYEIYIIYINKKIIIQMSICSK